MMMKKLLPALLTLLGAYTASAQVGIGTSAPNASAQLEIVSSDKGVLLPQVRLTSTTDTATITTGNVQSLLVYNIATNNDVKPGYYFWYINKWRRLVTSDDTVPTGGSSAPIVDNGNGTYTYINPDGSVTTIDVPGNQTLTYLMYNPAANTLTYTDEKGINTVINLVELVKKAETVTTLVDNGNGTMTYTNEAGVSTTVSVAGGAAGVGIATTVNNGDGTFTIIYTNGTTFTTSNLTGPQGPAGTAGAAGLQGPAGADGANGNGIANTVNNNDGTFTINYTNGTSFTTPNFTGAQGATGPQGPSGMAGTPGSAGVGIASAVNNGNGTFTLNFTNGSSFTTSNLTGPQGPAGAIGATGTNGVDGISAYQEWLNAGNTGTKAEFLATLKGDKGNDGVAGTNGTNGTDGTNGVDGISAYQEWLNAGNTGTKAEFLAALKGDKGNDGVAGTNGTNGTDGTNGVDGISAYQEWLNAGNTGTKADFLATLKGDKGNDGVAGTDGISAYQEWLNAGNTGTQAEFLAALKGDKGNDGVAGTDGNGITSTTDNNDGTFTFTYTDGTTFTTSNLKGADGATGAQGATGNGIASTTDNNDGTFTFTYTDGTTFTTSNLKGADGAVGSQGATGNGITSTMDNNDGTFTFTYSDGTTFTTSNLKGADGISAYQEWLNAGNTGTQADFLAALKGDKGNDGVAGTNGNGIASTTDNNDGTFTFTYTDGTTFTTSNLKGADGISAYQEWLNAGNTGTQADFLAALKGDKGNDGVAGTNGNGIASTTDNNDGTFTFTYTDGTTFTTSNLKGADGISAYQEWLNAGNTGTQAEFLVALKGADGTNGTDGEAGKGITTTVNNGDGTLTINYTDGTSTVIDFKDIETLTTFVNNGNGTYTYTNEDGVDTTIDVRASSLIYDNTISRLTSTTVQDAIDKLAAGQTAIDDSLDNFKLVDNANGTFSLIGKDGTTVVSTIEKSAVTANADGTYTFNNGGTPVTIDPSQVHVNYNNGIYTFTNAAGATITDIDVNANALPFDNNGTGLTATNVQAAIAEITEATITSKKDLLAADGADATIEVVGGTKAVLADTSLRVKDESITSAKIKDGTIITADIASTGNNKVLTTALNGTVTWADKSELAIEPWNNQNSTDKATSNANNIYQTGSIGIGDFSGENVSQKLDVKDGNVRVRDINASAGIATDKVVVADAQGVLKTVSAMPGIRTEIQDYSAVLADETILADAAGTSVTITLPLEPVMGKKYNIKKIDTSDNKVTISGNGKTIEGLSTISGALPYQGWVLQYNGSSWFIISRI